MNQIKFNAPWDPLRHVWVGTSYAPAFYEPIKSTRIRDSLQKIASETEEDYINLIPLVYIILYFSFFKEINFLMK
jgi:hypothetical protein